MSGGGDTPGQKTLFKYYVTHANVWFVGEFEPGENFLNAKIYGENENTYYLVNDEGLIIGKSSNNVEQLEQEISDAIENTYQQQVDPCKVVASEYQVGDTIENWGEFNVVARQ